MPLRLWWRGVRAWTQAWAYGALFFATGLFHLAEVHLLDGAAGALARRWTGWDFALAARLEAPLMDAIGRAHSPEVLAGVAAYYLLAFIGLLALVPGLVAAHGDQRLLKRTLLLYPALYAIALPFFLFFPSVNPYVGLAAPSPFAAIHPWVDAAYYWLTTPDNTFPSLHVAFTVALVAQALRTRWTLLKPMLVAHALLLTASVVYVRVHYIMDVVAGLAAAWLAVRTVDACLAQRGPLSGVGRALDRACARWSPWDTRVYRWIDDRLAG